jgi:hypothetical protein
MILTCVDCGVEFSWHKERDLCFDCRSFKAVELRLDGKTYREIGEVLGGVHKQRATQLTARGLRILKDPSEGHAERANKKHPLLARLIAELGDEWYYEFHPKTLERAKRGPKR